MKKWFELCTIKHYEMANRCVFLMALLTRDALKGAHAWTLVALLTGDFPEAGLPQDILHTAVSVLGLADEAPWV